MINENLEKRGYLMVMFSAICWGLLGTFIKKLGYINYDSISIAAFRPTIALIFYIILTLIQKPSDFKTDMRGLILFCIYGIVAYNGLFVGFSYAVELTTLSTAVILLYTSPIFVTILSYFFFGEPLNYKKVIALIATAIGCFLVAEGYKPGAFQVNSVGILWGLVSAIGFAMQSILGKIILRNYSHRTLLVYGFLFSALFLWFFRPPWILLGNIPGLTPLILILSIGIISTIIPNGLYASALKYVEASKASILTNLEPMVAVFLAFVLFNERLVIFQWVGIALILFSVVLVQYKFKERTGTKVE